MAWIGTATPQADRFILVAGGCFLLAMAGAMLFGLNPGWILFLAWVGACCYSASTGRSGLWALLVLTPLALISASWLTGGYPIPDDPFGMTWSHIYAFTGASLVTAATGILFFIQPRLWTPRPRHKDRAKT
jgi:hypothetical protein